MGRSHIIKAYIKYRFPIGRSTVIPDPGIDPASGKSRCILGSEVSEKTGQTLQREIQTKCRKFGVKQSQKEQQERPSLHLHITPIRDHLQMEASKSVTKPNHLVSSKSPIPVLLESHLPPITICRKKNTLFIRGGYAIDIRLPKIRCRPLLPLPQLLCTRLWSCRYNKTSARRTITLGRHDQLPQSQDISYRIRMMPTIL